MNSPPSTPITSPLMKSVPSPDRTTIALATSWGVVIRPVGFRLVADAMIMSCSGIFISAGVIVTPGPDRVGGDPLPRLGELHGQLADVRLERGLGR